MGERWGVKYEMSFRYLRNTMQIRQERKNVKKRNRALRLRFLCLPERFILAEISFRQVWKKLLLEQY